MWFQCAYCILKSGVNIIHLTLSRHNLDELWDLYNRWHPQKVPVSPCGWYSRPWFVLLLKPNVRTSPQRHSLWLQSDSASVIVVETHCIKVRRAAFLILTHRPLQHTEVRRLLTRDYAVVSNHISRILDSSSCSADWRKKDIDVFACPYVHSDLSMSACTQVKS